MHGHHLIHKLVTICTCHAQQWKVWNAMLINLLILCTNCVTEVPMITSTHKCKALLSAHSWTAKKAQTYFILTQRLIFKRGGICWQMLVQWAKKSYCWLIKCYDKQWECDKRAANRMKKFVMEMISHMCQDQFSLSSKLM